MKQWLLFVLFFMCHAIKAQINPENITIARDSFGVPHIFAPTDPESAYGLAWAHAEDDFATLQLVVLSGQAKLGTVLGKKGAEADYVVNLLRCRKIVEEKWNTLSTDFIQLVQGYVAGLNAYAKAHPNKVKYKKTFPFSEKDYMTAVMFSIAAFCGVDNVLPQILGEKVPTIPGFESKGSNAFAFHPSRTNTGEAFLAINAHQPMEGPSAFYEAHVQSDEGWNMLGGLLPGSCVILHGTNENLGWAHTVNYPDKIDVFQLQMNPDNSNQYKFDNEWVDLEVQKAKLKVKGIPVTINRNIYWSKYGATLKTKRGVFAIRLPAMMDIRAMEEWYRMNRAKNFTEFYQALSMMSLPMFNIVYADRFDTIFYISNVKLPQRIADPQYDWNSTLPGNTSATLWTTYKPINLLPQYLNPASGFLYNTNHSPFLATDARYNLAPDKFDRNDGFELKHNNRSQRVTELMEGIDKIDYETFRRIKFDQQLPKQLQYRYGIDSLLNLDANNYPEIKDVINSLQQWDRKAAVDSKGAAVFLLLYYYAADKLAGTRPRQLTIAESVTAYRNIQGYMIKYFGRTDLTLGDVQKLVRGDDARPAGGIPDVLTQAFSAPYKNGMRKVTSGDAYICLVRYPKDALPVIETVNTFGSSSDPASPHYKDQMFMFQNQQTKKMTLDKQAILQHAERIYHPGK
ncbi:MAG TPA: penicillin acylase family protein [Chitinophagaceae bacterium]|nr:penicillin acylase family protein [Chitinophagaceae bacterium]